MTDYSHHLFCQQRLILGLRLKLMGLFNCILQPQACRDELLLISVPVSGHKKCNFMNDQAAPSVADHIDHHWYNLPAFVQSLDAHL